MRRAPFALLAAVTAVSVAVGCASGPPPVAQPVTSEPAGPGPSGAESGRGTDAPDVRRVVEDVLPSIVSVQVREGRHSGSGFRVGIEGIVVTSAQAVAEAGDGAGISVVLADGSRRAATVLGRSTEVDIAALRVDDARIPAMHSRSGLARARPGDRVLAVRATAAGGDPAMSPIPATLRATDRRAVLAGGAELAVLALDAGVDSAASGAPVVNTAGDVLGVITTTVDAAPGADPGDGAFAIPVDIAREATFAIVNRA